MVASYMVDEELQAEAARHVLGAVKSWELPSIADRALKRGIYSEALDELAQVRNPIMSDVGPLFERALTELGIECPGSKSAAAWILLKRLIPKMARNEKSPEDGLMELMREVYWPADLHGLSQRCVGDSHDVNFLVARFWEYDELDGWGQDSRGETRRRQLDAEVIQFAKQWVSKHCP